jgi:hypothetical protein
MPMNLVGCCLLAADTLITSALADDALTVVAATTIAPRTAVKTSFLGVFTLSPFRFHEYPQPKTNCPALLWPPRRTPRIHGRSEPPARHP